MKRILSKAITSAPLALLLLLAALGGLLISNMVSSTDRWQVMAPSESFEQTYGEEMA